MNAAGHPTRHGPEYREPADNCCLLGASSLELATRTVDNSIATLGRTVPGNATRGVLLFSRPFIPVRKNYLTRRADAWGMTNQRGRSRLVAPGIPGQRPGSSRRLRDRQRPFFLASFQGARFYGGRRGVAPQAVVGRDALPPPPVLGYSKTLFSALGREILVAAPPVTNVSMTNISRGPPRASSGLGDGAHDRALDRCPPVGGGLIDGKPLVGFQPTPAWLASDSRTPSDDGDLAALRRVALQDLLDHAEHAEVRIRPFLDQDEMAFSAADAGRPVFLGRQLGCYRAQVSENTLGLDIPDQGHRAAPCEHPSGRVRRA